MSKPRCHFAGPEKVAILKRHLLDMVPVSDLCDELGPYPNQVYGWLKEFFENGHAAFDNGRKSKAAEAGRLTCRSARYHGTICREGDAPCSAKNKSTSAASAPGQAAFASPSSASKATSANTA